MDIGGIACLFQTIGPACVIIGVELKQRRITPAIAQKIGMIPVGFLRGGIAAKTLLTAVIVMIYSRPLPFVFTFDPEMIVRFFYQLAGAGLTLMDSLGKYYGSRDTGTLHLADRDILISVDIRYDIR